MSEYSGQSAEEAQIRWSLITLFPLINAGTEFDLPAFYLMVKAAGFDAVDICDLDFKGHSEEQVKKAIEDAGLCVACYVGFPKLKLGDTQATEGTAKQVRRDIDRARAMGAGLYMYAPNVQHEDAINHSREALREALANGMALAVEYATHHQMTVIIEESPNIDIPMCGIDDIRALLDATDGLRLAFDSGNMLPVYEDPVEFYEKTRGRMSHMHVKDMRYSNVILPGYGEGDLCVDGRRVYGVLHGEGIIDFTALFSLIKHSEYKGYLAVEYIPQSNDFECEMSFCLRRLQKVWAES